MVGDLMYFFHTAQLTSSARQLRNLATSPGFYRVIPLCYCLELHSELTAKGKDA